MKKEMYALLLLLVVVSGLVFAFDPFTGGSGVSNQTNEVTSQKPSPKPLSIAEMKAKRDKWEASPDGTMFKKWEESPAGKKVYASEAKIRKSLRDNTNMEGFVTSLSLPPGSRLGFGVMVKINGEDYILSFGVLNLDEFQELHSLEVNDKIIIRSHNVSHAPKYSYPIVSGDYVERDGKIIYKRPIRNDGC